MATGRIVSAEAQGLYKLFNPGKPTKADYDGSTLRITGGNDRSLKNEDIADVSLDLRLLHHAIILTLKDRSTVELSGFKEQAVKALHAAISRGIALQRSRELKQQAKAIEPDIRALHPLLSSMLPTDGYIRDSHCQKAATQINQVTDRCTPQVVKELSHSAGKMLRDIQHTENLVTSETKREAANRTFVRIQAGLAKRAVEQAEHRQLTQEQAEAVAIDEDVTLVAAGAGTGKTTVITAKIAHLVTNQKVRPEQILVLAYNDNAVKEIKERLAPELQDADVYTFHAFGRRVIGQTTEMPSVSKMVEDFQLPRTMQGFVEEMKKDHDLARALLNFTINMPAEYKSPFDPDIHSLADYQKYVKDSHLVTLNGETVKSFEELTIANWLAVNGIEYEYERAYEHHTATTQHQQYHPDFYLTHQKIYIEHFALNKQGNAPPGWAGYEVGVQWKEDLHKRNQTTLVKTYSWQHQERTLLRELDRALKAHKVERRRVPTEKFIKKFEIKINRVTELLIAFLNHAKAGNITQEQIDARASESRDLRRAGEFLKLWRYSKRRYDEQLQQEGTIDFHDMINQATSILSRGEWPHSYTHVLVDEFQDISTGRMALIKALMQDGIAYFLVGDDWQSIYRFTGSQVRLFNEVQEYLGFTRRVELSQTFRFGNDIAQPSARFIQQNPDQTQRTLRGADHMKDSDLTVIADSDQKQGAKIALRQIESRKNNEDTTLILGRFRRSKENLPEWAQKHFSTIHSAKGKEADYVIVLDLDDDSIYGFPCFREDDPILDLVAPPVDDNPYPYAEERRLFYVGMTRSKKATYLVADPNRPSPFIRELLRIAPEVRELGELSPACPACGAGHLVRSQSGDNLRCTNYPACKHLAPRCTACRQGYAVVTTDNQQEAMETRCTNKQCQHTERVCPKCQRGLLALRTNRQTGKQFWGCSEWRGENGCKFTQEIDDDQSLSQ